MYKGVATPWVIPSDLIQDLIGSLSLLLRGGPSLSGSALLNL